MAIAARLRDSGTPYLVVLLATPMVGQFAHFLDPSTAILKGQPAGVLIEYALVALAAVFWWMYRPTAGWSQSFHVFMAGLLLTWGVAMALAIVHGDNFDLTALLVPGALLLIWTKRPFESDVWRAADAFAWAVILAAVLAQAFDWLGWLELHREGWNRLPFLQELVGPIGRWEGPFGNVNHAGPIGAFLFAYGLYRRGARRIVFISVGIALVFFSDSRTSVFALATALVVGLVCAQTLGSWRVSIVAKTLAVGGLLMCVLGYVTVVDRTLNGRTEIWSAFVELWQTNPILGVGGAGIETAITSGDLQSWANHGHSLLIDPLGRVGILGLAPLVVALVAALVVTGGAARRGAPAGLVIIAGFLASGVTEDLVDWRYAGYQFVPVLIAGLLGAVAGRGWAAGVSTESLGERAPRS